MRFSRFRFNAFGAAGPPERANIKAGRKDNLMISIWLTIRLG
jgi:hypothetical protein